MVLRDGDSERGGAVVEVVTMVKKGREWSVDILASVDYYL